MEKLLLILTPNAGQRKARKALSDIIDVFNRAGFAVLTHITANPGDGETAVLRYASQVDRIVCCGGDGTFNETLSGVLKSGLDIPIGYIPAGSTNDFATSLGLSHDLLQAARDIVEGQPERLDAGLFGSRPFSYVASFGAFTRASYLTPQTMKNLIGHTAYVLGGIQELSQLKSWPLRLTLPDGSVLEDQFIFGAISNSLSMGGILTLSPDRVDMADGLFELLLVRTPKDLTELGESVLALQHKTYDSPCLTFCQAAAVTVDAPEDMAWTLDGEMEAGSPHIEIQCLPQAVQVFRKRTKPSV